MNKVTIVGAGRVGETLAQILAEAELCKEVALLDLQPDLPEGIALDITQTAPFFDFDTRVTGGDDPAVMAGSDLVVLTADAASSKDLPRGALLEANLPVVDRICDDLVKFAPDAILLVVAQPVDLLTYRAFQRTGWERQRILGQAGVLDASRMAGFIAMETGFSSRDISTIVIGGHGESMVPLPRFCTVSGIPVEYFIDHQVMQEIIDRTRSGGAEIRALRKDSRAYDAPAASVAAMIDSISHDRRRIMPSVAVLHGEFGEEDIAIGVPCVLGQGGVESIVQLELNPQELALFKRAVQLVREEISQLSTGL